MIFANRIRSLSFLYLTIKRLLHWLLRIAIGLFAGKNLMRARLICRFTTAFGTPPQLTTRHIDHKFDAGERFFPVERVRFNA